MDEYLMRDACKRCGEKRGYVEFKNGQDVVYCLACDAYAYCAPRSETGKPQRRVRTRPDIKPSQKVRVLLRDGGRCVICYADDKPLHVGHLIGLDEGRQVGATDEELFDDENLAAMCEECNLGLGSEQLSIVALLRVLRIRRKRRDG